MRKGGATNRVPQTIHRWTWRELRGYKFLAAVRPMHGTRSAISFSVDLFFLPLSLSLSFPPFVSGGDEPSINSFLTATWRLNRRECWLLRELPENLSQNNLDGVSGDDCRHSRGGCRGGPRARSDDRQAAGPAVEPEVSQAERRGDPVAARRDH